MNQQRVGILISYLNLVVGMIVTIFLTPFMIKSFGDVDYSVYKVMQSFAGPLGMFHLGISTVVTRSIVKCQNSVDYTKEDKQNTMALALLVSAAMSAFVIIAGVFMYFAIPSMYGETYTAENLELARKIFIVFVVSSVLHMLTDAFSGCVLGHEKYIISSSVSLMKTVIKVVLNFTFILCGMDILYIAITDLIIAVAAFLFLLLYSTLGLSEWPKLSYLDKKQLMEIFSFGMAIFLQAVVNQANNNVDTMILGAFVEEKTIITMYSSALTIYAIYNSIISVVTGLFLPKATELVINNASGRDLTDFVITPGRFQAMIAVACLFGFGLFGKNFISVWIGDQYLDAYAVTLILMIPVTIPLVENAAISILDASMKRMYRSAVLFIMAIINVAASVFLVKHVGYFGAAIGTFASLIIGHGILMNVYYARTFKMEIGRLFFSIFRGILPAGIAAFVICVPLSLLLDNTLILFVLKCALFMTVYVAFLLLFGINKSERAVISGILDKMILKLRG